MLRITGIFVIIVNGVTLIIWTVIVNNIIMQVSKLYAASLSIII